MRLGRKKEGWVGIALTVVLCLGFLYWWFRPVPKVWEQESAGQLVARAMAEPAPPGSVERQVIDFDLMEVAICQGRVGMLDEAVVTVKHVADPVIRLRAVLRLAQAFLHSGPKDFAEAIGLADLIADPGGRAAVRSEVLGELAELGFADAALPEAKSALQKASLARRMAATDGQEKARDLINQAENDLSSLSPDDVVGVREQIARARISLTPLDGADPAVSAISSLPPERQPALWQELSEWCDGEKIDLRRIMPHITDPALRRKLEVESLLFLTKPWPAAEIISKYRSEAAAAASPEAKVTAMISLSEAQRNSGEPDTTSAATVANQTLKECRTIAGTIGDGVTRCRALLELTKRMNLALLFEDAKSTLEEATKTARAVQPLSARVPFLIDAAEENLLQANAAEASALISEAATEAASSAPDGPALQSLATALVRRGDWPRGLALVNSIADKAAKLAALDAVAEAASDESLSMDPSDPPPRGEPVDSIRARASGDQARAANLVEKQPAGYARARAWLAMARGQIASPENLNDYMAAGAQAAGPDDGAPAPEAEPDLPPAGGKSE